MCALKHHYLFFFLLGLTITDCPITKSEGLGSDRYKKRDLQDVASVLYKLIKWWLTMWDNVISLWGVIRAYKRCIKSSVYGLTCFPPFLRGEICLVCRIVGVCQGKSWFPILLDKQRKSIIFFGQVPGGHLALRCNYLSGVQGALRLGDPRT